MLTDRRTHARTDGRTDDGRKVITIAHPEQSSGELKISVLFGCKKFLIWSYGDYIVIMKTFLFKYTENFTSKK